MIEALIRDSNPIRESDLPGRDSLEVRRLLSQIRYEPHRRVHYAKSISVGVAAAAIAVGVVTQGLLSLGSSAPSAAAAEFHRLSAIAAAAINTGPPAPGQYQFTDSVSKTEASLNMDSPQTTINIFYDLHRQIWIGTDGSGRIAESTSNVSFATATDRMHWLALGSPSLFGAGLVTNQSFGPQGLSDGPTNLWNLPTDTATLASQISSRTIEGGPPGTQEDFVQIGDLLRETDAPPALRAALFQVASNLPGIRLLGLVTTQTGQAGIGIAMPMPNASLDELIFDPTTSALLGEQVVTNSDDAIPVISTWTSYLQSGVVDSTSSTVTKSS